MEIGGLWALLEGIVPILIDWRALVALGGKKGMVINDLFSQHKFVVT